MKKKVFCLISITILIICTLCACGTQSSYRNCDLVSFEMSGNYDVIYGDEAVGYVIYYVLGKDFDSVDDVPDEDIQLYKNLVNKAQFYISDDSWISVQLFPTDYKAKEIKEFVTTEHEGLGDSYVEYEYFDNNNNCNLFVGAEEINDTIFYKVIAIKYGVLCEIDIYGSEDLAYEIANSLDFDKESMGTYGTSFGDLYYELPINFIDNSEDSWKDYSFLNDGKIQTMTVYEYDNAEDLNYAKDNLLSSFDIMKKEVIDTSVGEVLYYEAGADNFVIKCALVEGKSKYYDFTIVGDVGEVDAIKKIVESLDYVD